MSNAKKWPLWVRVLSSLRFAVAVILLLTFALIVATVLEAKFDTPTAQYYVYQALWFHLVLVALGVNIFVVAMSRLPWRRHHAAFLLAHAGILLLLAGSWVTYRFGLDGTMRLEEGQGSSVVELQEPVLFLMDGDRIETLPIGWRPPSVAFRPMVAKNYPIRVERFLTHADPVVSFVAQSGQVAESQRGPALHLRVQGGPMRIVQDYWLWSAHPQYSVIQAGPSRLSISRERTVRKWGGQGPEFHATVLPGGAVEWVAFRSDGTSSRGSFPAGRAAGRVVSPGWKGDVTLTLLEVLNDAAPDTYYVPSRTQYGNRAPSSAIELVTTAPGNESRIWLGLGERGSLEIEGREVGLAYLPRRVILPFQITLERFQIDRYAGTRDPAAYWSRVRTPDGREAVISMNEPLKQQGVTFYQASYEDAEPRPTVSIFSVNRDPGRGMKYLGSLLLVLGSTLLFYQKLKKGRPVRPREEVV